MAYITTVRAEMQVHANMFSVWCRSIYQVRSAERTLAYAQAGGQMSPLGRAWV